MNVIQAFLFLTSWKHSKHIQIQKKKTSLVFFFQVNTNRNMNSHILVLETILMKTERVGDGFVFLSYDLWLSWFFPVGV